MRSVMMILLFLLFCSLQILNAQVANDAAKSNCCIEGVTDVKIPVKRIESYYLTSDFCPGPRAVVFKTHGGKKICVNPEDALVKSHMKKVDNRMKK